VLLAKHKLSERVPLPFFIIIPSGPLNGRVLIVH
jgi:hypothetical protein